METKTFRGATMLEALQQVQKELGADAIVVSMREVEAGAGWPFGRKPSCEIVAAHGPRRAAAAPVAEPAAVQPVVKKPVAARPQPASETSGPIVKKVVLEKAVADAVAAVKTDPAARKTARPFKPQVVNQKNSTMTWVVDGAEERPNLTPAPAPAPATDKAFEPAELEEPEEPEERVPLAKIRKHLLDQGLDEALVSRLCQAAIEALSPARLIDTGYLYSFIKKQLQANLRRAELDLEEGHNVVCLIGPGGIGKTSTCAKLAAQFALQKGKRVAWIEANTVGTGAIAEARMITDSLGVEFYLAYTAEDLTQALESTKDADLVLVDTAGCNPRREASLVELGSMITYIPKRTTLLVMPATTKENDLKSTLAAFSPFHINGFVVTKMDETTTFGNIYNLIWRSKVPVAFYSTSPKVMDELDAGDGQLLINAIFNEGI